MIDPKDYAAWHGVVPMSKFLQGATWDNFFVEGKGCRLRDRSGRWYLDARSSLWNVAFGYDNAAIVDAMVQQLRTLPFSVTIRYERPPEITASYANKFAERLPPGLTRIRLGANGAQMTESAVLLSRFLRVLEGNRERMDVLALWGGFHGAGALASGLTGEPILHELLPIMPARVHHVTGPGTIEGPEEGLNVREALSELEARLEELDPHNVTAMMIEPVLGSGSVALQRDYLAGVRELCTQHGIHLIFDEVTTGFGRVGALTRCEQLEIEPDMIVLGKGMSGGYTPLAGLAVTEDIYMAAFDPEPAYPFPNGSTSDGNPIAAAAGLAVLELLQDGTVFSHVQERGAELQALLADLAKKHACIAHVSGTGLMHSVGFSDDGDPWALDRMTDLRLRCEARGVLVNTIGSTVALMPPLVISNEELNEVISVIDESLAAIHT